ncbi:hypothetical protein ABIE26_003929 [Pedobacter africanus]|uniref:Uncharacterized protein n=1 Tax=Pedobacter africanus TaxID=151894 RepID=A0ACC6L0S6_9SPHI|nr:hypothetical protein [Pedobacter africanus]MDR6785230.1 hypothetical protein [Pedobacter africanus]
MKTNIKQQNVFNKPINEEILRIMQEYNRLSYTQKKDERLLSVLIERYEKTKDCISVNDTASSGD